MITLAKWKGRKYDGTPSGTSVNQSEAADEEDSPALRKGSAAAEEYYAGDRNYEYRYRMKGMSATFEDDDEVEEEEEGEEDLEAGNARNITPLLALDSWRRMRSPPPETVLAEDQPRVETSEAFSSPPPLPPAISIRKDSETGSTEAPPQRYETMTIDADVATTAALKQRDEDKSSSKEMLEYYERKLETMSKNEEKYQSLIVQLRSQLADAKKPNTQVENAAIEETRTEDDGGYDSDDDNSSVDSDIEARQRDFLKERIGAALDASDFPEAEKYLREGLRKLNLEEKLEQKVAWNANLAEVLLSQKKFEEALRASREILAIPAEDRDEQGLSYEVDKINAHVVTAKALMGIGNVPQRKEAKTHCKKALKIIKHLDTGALQKAGKENEVQGRKHDAMMTMSMILDAEGETIEAAFYRSLITGKGRPTAEEGERSPGLQPPKPPSPTIVYETKEKDTKKDVVVDSDKVKLVPEITKLFGLMRGIVNGRIVTRKMGVYGAEQTEIQTKAIRFIMDLPEPDAMRLAYSLFHDPALLNTATAFTNSPLHLAIKKSRWCIASMLISRGADVNAPNTAKRSPLHLAANYKGTEENEPALAIMAQLLEKGADVNQLTGMPTSKRQGNLSTRLEQGVQAGPIPEGCTPLIISVVNNNSKAMKLLMAYGANPNIQLPGSGVTALHLAVSLRKDELVNILLEEGADYNIKNTDGRTARDIAPRSSRRVDGQQIFWEAVFEKGIKNVRATALASRAKASPTLAPPPPPPPPPIPPAPSVSASASISTLVNPALQSFRQARAALREERERSSPLPPPAPKAITTRQAPPPPPSSFTRAGVSSPPPPPPSLSRSGATQPPSYTRTAPPPPPPHPPPLSRSPAPPPPPHPPSYSSLSSSPPPPPPGAMAGTATFALLREHRRMGSASLASDLRKKSPTTTSPPPPTGPPPPPPPPGSSWL